MAFAICLCILLALSPWTAVMGEVFGPQPTNLVSELAGTVWQTPGNIRNQDAPIGGFATGVSAFLNFNNPVHQSSSILQLTQFLFNVPVASVVQGIEVNLVRMCHNPGGLQQSYCCTETLNIVKDSIVSSLAYPGCAADNYPNAFTLRTFGGPNDLWGLTGVDWQFVNSNSFGVQIVVAALNGIPLLDCLNVTVYYSEVSTNPTSSTSSSTFTVTSSSITSTSSTSTTDTGISSGTGTGTGPEPTAPTGGTETEDLDAESSSDLDLTMYLLISSGGLFLLLLIAGIIILVLILTRKKKKQEFVNLELAYSRTTSGTQVPQSPLATETKILQVDIKEKLGGGNFGVVYRGIWQGTEVAVKRLKQGTDEKEFLNEATVLQKLQHPNVVQYYGIHVSGSGDQYIVMEYLPLGSLRELIMKEKKVLTPLDLVMMCRHAAAGMSHLEGKRIIHRDLSLRNLLVGRHDEGSFMVKISDFGLSRSVESSYYSSETNIPVKWSAPEVLEYGTYTLKSDVYSFGVVMWELFSFGKLPYAEFDNDKARPMIINGHLLSQPSGCTDDVYDLMMWCWQGETENRPTFPDIMATLEQTWSEYKTADRQAQQPTNIGKFGRLCDAQSVYVLPGFVKKAPPATLRRNQAVPRPSVVPPRDTTVPPSNSPRKNGVAPAPVINTGNYSSVAKRPPMPLPARKEITETPTDPYYNTGGTY